jgi:hypothetical protein
MYARVHAGMITPQTTKYSASHGRTHRELDAHAHMLCTRAQSQLWLRTKPTNIAVEKFNGLISKLINLENIMLISKMNRHLREQVDRYILFLSTEAALCGQAQRNKASFHVEDQVQNGAEIDCWCRYTIDQHKCQGTQRDTAWSVALQLYTQPSAVQTLGIE